MRFRTIPDWTQLLVLAYVIGQTLLNIGRITHHLAAHRPIFASLEIAAQLALIFLGVQSLITLFRSHIRLTPSALRLRSGIFSKEIPYSSIAAIRPPEDSVKRNPRAVVIEIARLGPSIYPHQYVVLKVADRETFTRELMSKTPQASHEF